MKIFLLTTSLLLNLFAFCQCDEYYINELISGNDDKCYFEGGTKVRFCPNLQGMAIGELTLDIYQWDGISTQYITVTKNGGIAGTIVLKLNEKELLLNLNGCGGSRTYSISLSKNKYEQWLGEIEVKKNADDEKRWLLIDQLCLEKKIEAAKNEMDKLNYPQNYKNKKNIDTEYLSFTKAKKEREVIEDLVTINDIRRLLNSNDIEKVVQTWENLHSKTNLQNIKDSIFQLIHRNETGNVPVSLTNSDFPKFIELNKVQIGNSYKSITKDTNIIIQFDQLGKCLQKDAYTWNSNVFKKYSDDFFTYQTLKIPVSLKIKDTKTEKKAELLYAGTKKTLALSRKGNIYKLNLLSMDIIDLTTWEQNYDEKLPKNEVRIEVFFTRNLVANDIIIDSKEILKSNNQKLNPRTLRKVGRIATITAILGWFGLRIMENQSIK